MFPTVNRAADLFCKFPVVAPVELGTRVKAVLGQQLKEVTLLLWPKRGCSRFKLRPIFETAKDPFQSTPQFCRSPVRLLPPIAQ